MKKIKKIICKNCKKEVEYEQECLEGLGYCCIPCAIEDIVKKLNRLERRKCLRYGM